MLELWHIDAATAGFTHDDEIEPDGEHGNSFTWSSELSDTLFCFLFIEREDSRELILDIPRKDESSDRRLLGDTEGPDISSVRSYSCDSCVENIWLLLAAVEVWE